MLRFCNVRDHTFLKEDLVDKLNITNAWVIDEKFHFSSYLIIIWKTCNCALVVSI